MTAIETYVREVRSIDGHLLRFERDEPLFGEPQLGQCETRIYVDDQEIDATGAAFYWRVTGEMVVITNIREFVISDRDQQ